MLEIISSSENGLCSGDSIIPGCWVRLIMPTDEEIARVSRELKLNPDDLKILLDEEELPRLEHEETYTLVLVDTPYKKNEEDITSYQTIPAGFVIIQDIILTISLRRNQILDKFASGNVKNFNPAKQYRFLLQFLYANAGLFVQNLRLIDKRTRELEKHLRRATRNEELFQMLNLSKSLVYITNSLKGNTSVLEKFTRFSAAADILSETEKDLLDDTILENRQAFEMAQNYSATISSTVATFASIISNNVNGIMKIFTFATVLLTIPMLIAGFFGMNVIVPFSGDSISFWAIIGISCTVSALIMILIYRQFMR
ncbi:MAG: magnesium transporter CorA family protein [Methanocorpusculum parvum]|nr:magnesium transporter CorA family protein [Methanocorpusculum parvum]